MYLKEDGRGWLPIVLVHALLIQSLAVALRPAIAYAVLESTNSASILGILSAAFAVPALFLALPAGRLADRMGERFSAVLGSVLVIAATLVALFGRESVVALLGATLLLGCGHMLSIVSEQALVANRAHSSRLDSAFGMYSLAASVGQSLGPLLLALPGPNAATPPLEVVFAICVGMAVALAVTSLLMRRTPAHSEQAQPNMFKSTGALLRRPGVFRALIAGSISVSAVEVILAYWPAMGRERHLDAAVISAMLVTRAVSSVVSRSVLARSAKRFGRAKLMIGSLLISAVAMMVIALPIPAAALIAAAGVFGFFIGISQPLTMSWLTSITPPGNRGMTMSLRLAGNRISQSTIPAGLGTLAAATGPAGVLIASGLALVVAASTVRVKNFDPPAEIDPTEEALEDV